MKGTGTPQDPFVVEDSTDFGVMIGEFNTNPDGGQSWEIGADIRYDTPFPGLPFIGHNLDGKGYRISGLRLGDSGFPIPKLGYVFDSLFLDVDWIEPYHNSGSNSSYLFAGSTTLANSMGRLTASAVVRSTSYRLFVFTNTVDNLKDSTKRVTVIVSTDVVHGGADAWGSMDAANEPNMIYIAKGDYNWANAPITDCRDNPGNLSLYPTLEDGEWSIIHIDGHTLPVKVEAGVVSGLVTIDGQPAVRDVCVTNTENNMMRVTKSDESGNFSIKSPTGYPVIVTVYDRFDIVFQPNTALTLDTLVAPSILNGFRYRVTTAGTTDATEPTWPVADGLTVTSGTVEFTAEKVYEPVTHGPLIPAPVA